MSSPQRLSLVALGLLVAALAGCPAPTQRAPMAPKDLPVASGPAAPPAARPTSPGTPLLDPRGSSCAAASCAFHAGAAGYFSCLAGGAGACFHFAGPCQPADGCMFDPTDRVFKRCAQVVEGACQRYGAACEPAGTCWYRAEDRLYRECVERKPGGCTTWGAVCAPATPALAR